MYPHVSECENDKIKGERKNKQTEEVLTASQGFHRRILPGTRFAAEKAEKPQKHSSMRK
jgi:hypothetical protein